MGASFSICIILEIPLTNFCPFKYVVGLFYTLSEDDESLSSHCIVFLDGYIETFFRSFAPFTSRECKLVFELVNLGLNSILGLTFCLFKV